MIIIRALNKQNKSSVSEGVSVLMMMMRSTPTCAPHHVNSTGAGAGVAKDPVAPSASPPPSPISPNNNDNTVSALNNALPRCFLQRLGTTATATAHMSTSSGFTTAMSSEGAMNDINGNGQQQQQQQNTQRQNMEPRQTGRRVHAYVAEEKDVGNGHGIYFIQWDGKCMYHILLSQHF